MYAFDRVPDEGAKKARMEQRISPDTKALIEKAARLQGVNPSEFVVAHAVAAAHETIRSMETTRLCPEDADAFMRAFEATDPTPDLVKLMGLHRDVLSGGPDGN